jgi:hypothetical protein
MASLAALQPWRVFSVKHRRGTTKSSQTAEYCLDLHGLSPYGLSLTQANLKSSLIYMIAKIKCLSTKRHSAVAFFIFI